MSQYTAYVILGIIAALVIIFLAVRYRKRLIIRFRRGKTELEIDGTAPDTDSPPGTGSSTTHLSAGDASVVGSTAGHDNIAVGHDYRVEKHYHKHYHGTEAAQGAASALHQLPSAPRDFVGRAHELDDLRREIRKGGAIISCTGMGGVGKTALALVLAHEMKGDYPNGQIFYDLRGADPEKRTPATTREAMLHVVASLAPEAKAPDDDATLRALYCALLDGKRILLLMDNAASREQVLPLVPPASCTLLITTRRHFDLAGLYRRNLDELPPEDARALLVEKCPRVGDLAADLAERCGRLPLMLEKAAGVLNTRPNLSPQEYLERLGDAKARLGLIEASLSLSYDCLPAELQARFAMLSVFAPGSAFGHAAAAAVWGAEPDAAKDALGDLLTASLIQYDADRDRYRLHDLVCDFAQSRLSKPDRTATEARHAEHYKNVLATANDLFLEGGEKILEGLALFDSERENVEAGQAWSAARAEMDKTAARLCSAYPDAGVYVLDLRQHPREQIAWLESALAAARRLKDRDAEGNHLGNLGTAYSGLGETRRAIECYGQCLIIHCEIGDRRGEGADLGNLGLAYADLGETRRAIEYYEKDLVIAREIGNKRGEGNALGNLGLAYAALGEAHRAIEHYEKALVIAREIGNKRGEGNALGNLGIAYKDLGETRRAIECYEQCLIIHCEIGDRRGEGADLGNLGIAYKKLGETRRAIEYYEKRLEIAREIGDRRGEGNALGNLGNAYADLGEAHRAIEYYEQVLAIDREIGDRRGEGNALWNTALALNSLGRRKEAIENAAAAIEIYKQTEHPSAEKVRRALAKWKKESE